ncbi:cytochrome P450 CYP82D47-like protein [Tanacetum coccineum]
MIGKLMFSTIALSDGRPYVQRQHWLYVDLLQIAVAKILSFCSFQMHPQPSGQNIRPRPHADSNVFQRYSQICAGNARPWSSLCARNVRPWFLADFPEAGCVNNFEPHANYYSQLCARNADAAILEQYKPAMSSLGTTPESSTTKDQNTEQSNVITTGTPPSSPKSKYQNTKHRLDACLWKAVAFECQVEALHRWANGLIQRPPHCIGRLQKTTNLRKKSAGKLLTFSAKKKTITLPADPILYGEILAAALHMNNIDQQANILTTLCFFDEHGSDHITKNEPEEAGNKFLTDGASRGKLHSNNKESGDNVPEADGSWPIISHLHLLAGSQVPHKVLGSMADKLGPIFTFKLSAHRVLVVSNVELAKECLTTNDRVSASRPKSMAIELMSNNYDNVALAPHGPYWREIRKIVVLELVSHRRLQMLTYIRVSEVNSSMYNLYKAWINNKGSSEMVKVDMKEWFSNLILNIVVRMMFGTIGWFSELLAAFVPSDAIPGLRWLDLGGYEKKMKRTAKDMDIVIDLLLEEHKKKMAKSQVVDSNDEVFITALLFRAKEQLKEDLHGFNTNEIVKATCLAIFAADTDTTTVTLTWALSLLVNNPLILAKAQRELENRVGRDRKVEESDLKDLVYLQAIIKEAMRLYPAAPLLVPHESTEECIVGGYTIPKGTRLLVNIWKVQHDPQIWTDPFEFQPERFLTSKKEIDVKGQ